jgi:hypothetical protein
MALRNGHGTGAGVPRVEVLPVDELPAGVPEQARAESPSDRDERGLFARGNGLASQGGKARAGKTRLADRLGLGAVPVSASFAPYKAAAVSFRRAQCAALAASVGGGRCGPGPSSLVASSSLQLAWSRYLTDIAGAYGDDDGELVTRASKLANDSRQNILAATELCAKEATARRNAPSTPRNELPAWMVDEEEGGADGQG